MILNPEWETVLTLSVLIFERHDSMHIFENLNTNIVETFEEKKSCLKYVTQYKFMNPKFDVPHS